MSAAAPTLRELRLPDCRPLHVLTLTPFFPTPQDDARGCFVAEPLAWTSQRNIRNQVLAVQPFYRSAPPSTNGKRFFSLPGNIGLATAGLFLFSRLLGHIRRVHSAQPIELIHAHSALPCGHAAALLNQVLGVPFVVTVHGLDAYSTEQVQGAIGRQCKRISQFVYRSARQVICVSAGVREHVLAGAAGPVKTRVIYNGVDSQTFAPHEPRASDDGSQTILSVGNLIPIKGHELVLRALATLSKDRPGLRCEIVGDGAERVRLAELALRLGLAARVTFAGRRSRAQVAQSMRDCQIFALPSRYEGLGCVYLEAMSSGKPVIACRGQGIEEIIRHGVNGWLIDPGDQAGLVNALSSLLDDGKVRHRIGVAARQTVVNGLTLAHQAERLCQSYRESAG